MSLTPDHFASMNLDGQGRPLDDHPFGRKDNELTNFGLEMGRGTGSGLRLRNLSGHEGHQAEA